MKIYFEDGKLNNATKIYLGGNAICIDADDGVMSNVNRLNYYFKRNKDLVIYTNSMIALNNKYAWNKELNIPEVFIKVNDSNEFTRIDKLTEIELKEEHNLANMYITGKLKRKVEC